MAPAIIRYPAQAGTSEMRNAYPQHNVSDAGQVFFETANSLIARDTNGQRDVYEYENGMLSLISSGTSEVGSYFLDATPTGSNVFFATAQRLLPRDVDPAYDYYDARTEGGFPEPTVTIPSCSGESCRSTAVVPPVLMAPSSTVLAPVAVTAPKPPVKKIVQKKAKKKKKKPKKKPKKKHVLKRNSKSGRAGAKGSK
jgi:hypothetical protein